MSICPVYGGGNWNGYLIPHTGTRQSVQRATSTFIEYIHSLSSVESWAGKSCVELRFHLELSLNLNMNTRNTAAGWGVPWPGRCYQAINSRGGGEFSAPHSACHQSPARGGRECSAVLDGKCGIENGAQLASVWLHLKPFFWILINLLTTVWQATWPRRIFYILLNTQNVGARRNSSVSLRVLMLMLCYYCCWAEFHQLSDGWLGHTQASEPINPATSPARPV